MKNIGDKILSVIDRALGGPASDLAVENMARAPRAAAESVGMLATPLNPDGTPRVTHTPAVQKGELDNVSNPIEGQLEAVKKLVSLRLSSPDRERFLALTAQEKNLTQLSLDHRPDAARAAWQKSVEDTAKRVALGEDITASDNFTWADFKEDFAIKVKVYRDQRRIVEKEMREIIARYLAPYAVEVDRLADAEEATLKAAFAKYGCAYSRAPFIWILRKIAHMAREGNTTVLPKSFFTK